VDETQTMHCPEAKSHVSRKAVEDGQITRQPYFLLLYKGEEVALFTVLHDDVGPFFLILLFLFVSIDVLDDVSML
jgi:hypothetical protein